MPSRSGLPPLNALRAFDVAGRKLNFRAAADELGVTQGAVAQQVRLLEKHLGVPLFHRLPRGVALTAHGATYLAEVNRAFGILTEATGQLAARSDAVTISVTPTFATKLLIPRLADLAKSLPGIEPRIIATEALSDFDRDRVDLAVRLTRPPFPAGLEARLLFQQELIAVASPQLVGATPLPLSPDHLRGLPLLHDAQNFWPLFFGTTGSLPGTVFNQTTLALDAAMAGQGIALACRAFAQADLNSGRLVQVAERALATEPSYFLVRKRSTSSKNAAEAVWSWCAKHLAFP